MLNQVLFVLFVCSMAYAAHLYLNRETVKRNMALRLLSWKNNKLRNSGVLGNAWDASGTRKAWRIGTSSPLIPSLIEKWAPWKQELGTATVTSGVVAAKAADHVEAHFSKKGDRAVTIRAYRTEVGHRVEAEKTVYAVQLRKRTRSVVSRMKLAPLVSSDKRMTETCANLRQSLQGFLEGKDEAPPVNPKAVPAPQKPAAVPEPRPVAQSSAVTTAVAPSFGEEVAKKRRPLRVTEGVIEDMGNKQVTKQTAAEDAFSGKAESDSFVSYTVVILTKEGRHEKVWGKEVESLVTSNDLKIGEPVRFTWWGSEAIHVEGEKRARKKNIYTVERTR